MFSQLVKLTVCVDCYPRVIGPPLIHTHKMNESENITWKRGNATRLCCYTKPLPIAGASDRKDRADWSGRRFKFPLEMRLVCCPPAPPPKSYFRSITPTSRDTHFFSRYFLCSSNELLLCFQNEINCL